MTGWRAIAIAACAAIAHPAIAAECVRPTGSAGDVLGYTYGSATVLSFGNASVLVWYTTEGDYAVNPASTRADGVPDDVAEVAQVTSDALASYAQLGYRAPVSDAATPDCGDDGGDGRLDVYLVAMTGGDGTTVAEPGRCTMVGAAAQCASYILAKANYAGLYPTADIGIHTVLPHETFHAVQNAYDANLDRFWAEGTAQWAAKTLDPSLTDLERFLPAWFAQTDRSLDASPNGVAADVLYGAAIWPVFLTQHHTDDIVRAILDQEGSAGGPALAATDVVLQTMTTTLASEFATFAAWNAATGTRAGSDGYASAATYPMVNVAEFTDSAQNTTAGYASYYYHLVVDAPAIVSLDTDALRNHGTLIPLVGGVAQLAAAMPVPATADAPKLTIDAGESIVVVSGITANKTDAPFTLTVAPSPPLLPPPGPPSDGCSASGRGEPVSGVALVLAVGILRVRARRLSGQTAVTGRRAQPTLTSA